MLKELTEKYIHAFSNRSLDGVSELLLPEFALEDPVVKRIEGKDNVLWPGKPLYFAKEQNLSASKDITPNSTPTTFTIASANLS